MFNSGNKIQLNNFLNERKLSWFKSNQRNFIPQHVSIIFCHHRVVMKEYKTKSKLFQTKSTEPTNIIMIT